MRASLNQEVLERLRAEYLEMPGLRLTAVERLGTRTPDLEALVKEPDRGRESAGPDVRRGAGPIVCGLGERGAIAAPAVLV
jgi:hypothetical protein